MRDWEECNQIGRDEGEKHIAQMGTLILGFKKKAVPKGKLALDDRMW